MPSASSRAARTCSRKTSSRKARSTPTRRLVESARAVVAADRAAIESAQVGLSYSRIVAPAAGRAGAINVFPGSTVQPSGNALVTITQLDPIAVAFSLPQRNLADALADAARRRRQGRRRVLPESGAARRRQAQVRRQRRRCRLRARSASRPSSPTRTSSSGRAPSSPSASRCRRSKDAMRAAAGGRSSRAPRGKIVYVVDAGHKASARPVEIVYARGEEVAVTGVKPGERIVLDGRQNLRPGATVIDRPAGAAAARPARRCGVGRGDGAAGAGATRGRARPATGGAAGAAVSARPAGSAMNLSELFIRRPVLTVLLNAAIVVAGAIAFNKIPVAALPSYNTPVINVSAQLPGASPETMATSVALQLEKQFQTIPGLTVISSSNTLGATSVTLEFDQGRDIDAAAVDVQAALLRAAAPAAERHDGAAGLPQGQPGRRAGAVPGA